MAFWTNAITFVLNYISKYLSNLQPRKNLLDAASRVGEASSTVLTEIHEEDETLRGAQDTLLGLGKAVANKAAALVLRGKAVASTLGQPEQNKAIGMSYWFIA